MVEQQFGTRGDLVNAIIGCVNFGSTCVGLVLHNFFGRKTLIFGFNILMALSLLALGIFLGEGEKYQRAAIAMVMLFILMASLS